MDNAAEYISNLTVWVGFLTSLMTAVRHQVGRAEGSKWYEVNEALLMTVVMNFTEMEALVREATNNEPWGASSTQLSEIAEGTHN